MVVRARYSITQVGHGIWNTYLTMYGMYRERIMDDGGLQASRDEDTVSATVSVTYSVQPGGSIGIQYLLLYLSRIPCRQEDPLEYSILSCIWYVFRAARWLKRNTVRIHADTCIRQNTSQIHHRYGHMYLEVASGKIHIRYHTNTHKYTWIGYGPTSDRKRS